jgi:hypothetical protein
VVSDQVRMLCALGLSPYEHGRNPDTTQEGLKWVPFLEALHNPPLCHGLPMETRGATAIRRVGARFWETGNVTAECRLYDSGQCTTHGWHRWEGEDGPRDGHCGYQRIAAWIVRRHEVAA